MSVHPQNSPDLDLCDFFLFRKLKEIEIKSSRYVQQNTKKYTTNSHDFIG